MVVALTEDARRRAAPLVSRLLSLGCMATFARVAFNNLSYGLHWFIHTLITRAGPWGDASGAAGLLARHSVLFPPARAGEITRAGAGQRGSFCMCVWSGAGGAAVLEMLDQPGAVPKPQTGTAAKIDFLLPGDVYRVQCAKCQLGLPVSAVVEGDHWSESHDGRHVLTRPLC